MGSFIIYFRKLLLFKDQIGHCYPNWGIVLDENLIIWSEMIRSGKFLLTVKEKEQLINLGFEFDSEKAEWLNMYYWADHLKNKRGSFTIDPSERALQPLREWIGYQKLKHQKGTLPEDKIVLLEKMGLRWSNDKTDQWEERFKQLCAFIKEKDSIPSSIKRNNLEKILYNWLVVQRKKEKKGNLTGDQLEKLKALGIPFKTEIKDSKDRIWMNRYQELKEFYNLHGHSKVNVDYNRSLYDWAMRQSTYIDTLSKEKREKLLRLRFKFKPSKQQISVSVKNLVENLEEKALLISPYAVPKI